jgi:hypothetical protein
VTVSTKRQNPSDQASWSVSAWILYTRRALRRRQIILEFLFRLRRPLSSARCSPSNFTWSWRACSYLFELLNSAARDSAVALPVLLTILSNMRLAIDCEKAWAPRSFKC